MDEATLGCFAAEQDELRAMAHPSGTGSASDAVCLSCKWTCCALVWRIQRASSLCGGEGRSDCIRAGYAVHAVIG